MKVKKLIDILLEVEKHNPDLDVFFCDIESQDTGDDAVEVEEVEIMDLYDEEKKDPNEDNNYVKCVVLF